VPRRLQSSRFSKVPPQTTGHARFRVKGYSPWTFFFSSKAFALGVGSPSKVIQGAFPGISLLLFLQGDLPGILLPLSSFFHTHLSTSDDLLLFPSLLPSPPPPPTHPLLPHDTHHSFTIPRPPMLCIFFISTPTHLASFPPAFRPSLSCRFLFTSHLFSLLLIGNYSPPFSPTHPEKILFFLIPLFLPSSFDFFSFPPHLPYLSLLFIRQSLLLLPSRLPLSLPILFFYFSTVSPRRPLCSLPRYLNPPPFLPPPLVPPLLMPLIRFPLPSTSPGARPHPHSSSPLCLFLYPPYPLFVPPVSFPLPIIPLPLPSRHLSPLPLA